MLVRQLDPDDLAGYRLAQLLGMTAGTAAGLGQAAQPAHLETLHPLVAGLGTDPILPAQLPEVGLRVERLLNKHHFLIHLLGFFPGHEPMLITPALSRKVLPMF
jgi:hypothetical protein